MRREELILEIRRLEPYPRREVAYADRLVEIARQRLLAGQATQRAAPRLDRVDDLLDVLDACVIRPADPDRVDVRICHHVRDRSEGATVAHVEIPRELRHLLGTLALRAPHPANVRLAHPHERLHMKAGDEAPADETNAEPTVH